MQHQSAGCYVNSKGLVHSGRNVGKDFSPFLAGTEDPFTIHIIFSCDLKRRPAKFSINWEQDNNY